MAKYITAGTLGAIAAIIGGVTVGASTLTCGVAAILGAVAGTYIWKGLSA